MHAEYKYQTAKVDVMTHACDDGDVIVTIGRFPASFTFYMTAAGAETFAQQIAQAAQQAAANQKGE